MQFNIEIVDVSAPKPQPNKKGGINSKIEVAFKKDGKIEAKAFLDFNKAYNRLATATKGEWFLVTAEKNAAGYWDWNALEEAFPPAASDISEVGTAAAPPTATTPAYTPSATRTAPKSNYETSDERAVKQRYIVRQSSISAAIAYAAAREPKGITLGAPELIELAKTFEEHVFS